jgi:GNAT superfamily N-acetyltransferase
MQLKLVKATPSDADAIFEVQVSSFKPLLEKYKDYDTNPANETKERVIQRISNPHGGFFKILVNDVLVGAIRVLWKEGTTCFGISPMFILPEHQGKGIAQKTISLIEEMYPQATSWELRTILEEERNCYLYEKMGYSKTGETKTLNDRTTLVSYQRLLRK